MEGEKYGKNVTKSNSNEIQLSSLQYSNPKQN